MIKPSDKFSDVFKEFPALSTQISQKNKGFLIFRIPLVGKWAANKEISRVSGWFNESPEEVISFLNRKIGENAGCFSVDEKNIKELPGGFYKSSAEEMEKIEEMLKKTSPEKIISLDVSELPAPEPLMKIREALMKDPQPLFLKVRHRRYPLHLPNYLKDKPYYVYAYAKAEEEIAIFVFHKSLLENKE